MVDQLFVTDPDGSSRTFSMTGDVITIGRTAANDIVLPLDTISSRHVRLERRSGGWQITDLGSTNGTFLGDEKLTPNVPRIWEPGSPLRLEPLTLTWEAAEKQVIATPPVSEEILDPPTQTLAVSGGATSNLSSIKIEPMSVILAPGELKSIEVTAVNQAQHVEQYVIYLEGLPDKWVEFTEDRAKEMPNYQETRFRFTIRVPAEDAPAKTYPYRVVLRSVSDRRAEGNAFGNVLVKPEPRYKAGLNPRKMKNGGTFQLVLENQGNVDLDFLVSGQEEDEPIQFSPPSLKVSVPAGQEERAQFKVGAAQRHLTGRVKQSPFEFQLEPDKGDTRFVKGELEVHPRLPQRIFLFLVLLLGLPTVFTFAGIKSAIDAAQLRAADSAVIAIVNVTMTATAAGATATSDAIDADSATATAEARTTEAWLALDHDEDGLTNGEELELETDPYNSDTDGDGLKDGQEVAMETDPLTRHSDTDRLNDGTEVAMGIDPLQSDTDGDGTRDDADPNPVATPIPPPTPEINLLENPSFELSTQPFTDLAHGIINKTELQVPIGWYLFVDNEVENNITGGTGENFVFPEMVTIMPGRLSECVGGVEVSQEPICAIFTGEQALKVFKDSLPIRFALADDVILLTPGVYRFRVSFFADTYYDGPNGEKVYAESGSAEVQLCLEGAEYPHMDWEPVSIGTIDYREVEFVVREATEVTLYAKFRNTRLTSNNGWFLDGWNLQQVGDYTPEIVPQETEHGCKADLTQAYSNR